MAHSLRTSALCVSVGTIAVVGAATHATVAGSSQGVTAWMMAMMAILCLAGLGQLRRTDKAVRRVAVHLSVMSGGMALVHAAWLLLAGGQQAGHRDHTVPAMSGSDSHGTHMLAVILVELICMAAAMCISRHLASRSRAREPIL